MEEDQRGEPAPATGTGSAAAEQVLPAAWESLLGAACLFFAAGRAQARPPQVVDSLRFAGGFSLEWHLLAATGESHQRGGNGRGKGTAWSTCPWAVSGVEVSGVEVSGVEVSEVLAEHRDVKWWPFPSLACY